jgi:hypothetical protein
MDVSGQLQTPLDLPLKSSWYSMDMRLIGLQKQSGPSNKFKYYIYIFILLNNLYLNIFYRVSGLVVRVPGYKTKMNCFLWGTNWIYVC